MAIKKELIQFVVVNSTDCGFDSPLFQQNVYSINATTKYSWDITGEDITCGTGSLVINGVTYNFSYTASSLTSLLESLNLLGFGFFCSEVISGNTYIYTTDDTNIYGILTLCGATTTTTTTTTTAAPTTTTTSTTSTTTSAPTTTTTTTTTTDAPTTTTTTTTTTDAPTTTTTTTTTTDAPTTTTTTTTTTDAPTTTTTTTTTTDAPTTTTTTTTTTTITCNNYNIEGAPSIDVEWLDCDGTTNSATVTTAILVCAQTGSVTQTGGAGNITQLGSCTSPTTTTTTTLAPTTTTSTTTTTTTANYNLLFDFTSGGIGFTVNAIDVNTVTPTLISGAGVPFNSDTHLYNTTQVGLNETLNISVNPFIINGCITVTDSASNVYQQNVTSATTYTFSGVVINNSQPVIIVGADNAC